MTNYVCGFCFSEKLSKVALIEKKKPKWQEGLLNGIGGKIEIGENAAEAMRREFIEEAGLDIKDWNRLITLTTDEWTVHFFYAVAKVNEFEYIETQEAEEVLKISVDCLDAYQHVSNLRWLIPMAIYKNKFPKEKMLFIDKGSVTDLNALYLDMRTT